ncbi:hypothetical protein HOL21_02335 [Candidatus Woesearchaeota archaeon]|jgi:hypothetical protein|nr:hypothetical protein [Candidatus Woesearchaeota archaeon]MBT5397029.1 hypothetical protein [Candidatus Woesearchaeota archaeon]MBT5924934.1 hypothetical protein [Candidatus Woesearchaeota archaeon]MBT6367425.1 hypothetical protein [Candidatus Woesearchaeota archaeon]MBT7762429.1 hypothetical protein [Candidatus Woesearchaeota archaeon]
MEEEKKKDKKKSEDEVYPAEEQGILQDTTSEEKKEEMEHGEREEDPLTKEGREKLVEDGEMEPWEAGFAEGASDEGQHAKDALTGEPLMDVEDVVEAEIEGKMYRFTSEENAQKFREKKEKEDL